MYLVGHVVVRRVWAPVKRQRARVNRIGWTLHRDDCVYVKGGRKAATMPAPLNPHEGTVPCKVCKPEMSTP